MSRIVFVITMLFAISAHADFVHPMDYDGSAKQKRALIEYIDERMMYEYCYKTKDKCRNTTLRMMLSKNMRAFDEASKAEDRALMDKVIAISCSEEVDKCNYPEILQRYKKGLVDEASDARACK